MQKCHLFQVSDSAADKIIYAPMMNILPLQLGFSFNVSPFFLFLTFLRILPAFYSIVPPLS